MLEEEWRDRKKEYNHLMKTINEEAPRKESMISSKFKAFEKSIPVGKFVNADDIAKLVLFLCSDFSRSINGTNITIDGGESISY